MTYDNIIQAIINYATIYRYYQYRYELQELGVKTMLVQISQHC